MRNIGFGYASNLMLFKGNLLHFACLNFDQGKDRTFNTRITIEMSKIILDQPFSEIFSRPKTLS